MKNLSEKPIEEFERLEEVIENYGLAKLLDEVSGDEQLSFQETKNYYKSLKKIHDHIFLTITSNDPSSSFSGKKEAQQGIPPR